MLGIADGRLLILILNETAEDTLALTDMLSESFWTVAVPGGHIGIQEAMLRQPSLLLVNGGPDSHAAFHTTEAIRKEDALARIPVLILADMEPDTAQSEGLRCGADDCLVKPVSPLLLIKRIRHRLRSAELDMEACCRRELMEQEIIRKNLEIMRTQEFFISALASFAETRDNETGLHIERTRLFMSLLIREIKQHGPKEYRLSEVDIRLIIRSAPLHDIGKIGIPDSILMKHGSLSPAEFDVIKTHTEIGFQSLERAERTIGYSYDFLRHAKDIVRYHHEWWDGTGYPEGLRGHEIPLSARLMAVADVYDALISNRVYKSAMSHEMAVSIIQSERGTHFDPVIVDGFLAKRDRFSRIAARMAEVEWKTQDQITTFLVQHGCPPSS